MVAGSNNGSMVSPCKGVMISEPYETRSRCPLELGP